MTPSDNNNSDYNTPSTDLFDLLPAPYQSNTNRAVFSNLFNRFLSKNETTQVIGYIGDGNPAAVVVRKIKEPTVAREAYQLQPLLYNKIGSVEYISSWKDILDELTTQGVDISRLPEWGNATIFNWAPPIDINKVVNYQDYYWYDVANPTSQPQYITVKGVVGQTTAGWDTTPWDTGPWDDTAGITGATIAGLDQWIIQNKWAHKTEVTNFTIAKRAQAPIIEFEPNLELNEWIQTTYSWSYRVNATTAWITTTAQPTRFELEPINLYTSNTHSIVIDERFGDLTNIFVPGYKFIIAGIQQIVTVVSSTYQRYSGGGAFQTNVQVVETLPILNPATNYLQPELTSQGDQFIKYGNNWLFNGINTTTAINHQPENNMLTPSVMTYTDASGFTYTLAPYAEEITTQLTNLTTFPLSTQVPSGSTRSMQQRALVGYNDIRVYLNGVRQYGSYDELGTVYVTGIQFLTPLPAQTIITVEVGEAAFSDFGNYAIPVRTFADDAEYASFGNILTSLVSLRINEQIKTAVNQYPLFDIYFTNSQSADIANNIFGYHEDPTGILYPYLSRRVVTRSDGSIEFQNNLIQTNNGVMYAYRNYNKSVNEYWFDTNTQTLLVWTGETWSNKYEVAGFYETPLVATVLPNPITVPLGYLVYNTTNNILYQRVNTSADWAQLPVTISNSDQTLETVWRHGLNNEQTIPAQVDWLRRSFPEYTTEYNTYITTTAAQLIQVNPSLTQAEADTEADSMWTAQQENNIVQAWYSDPDAVREGPLWVGEWQVPDELYYNVSHQNYLYVSTRDLLTHFQSIVDAQPPYEGFVGQPSANWNLIPYTQINWGLGGTIHEYDNSFDTFLSAEFTNTVTPTSLFSFAQSEYENTLVTLGQTFQRNAVLYLTTTDTTTIQDPGTVVSNAVILAYEENEAANLIYGDSTTFQQATSTTPASGIENFIATLPYFGIVPKRVPYENIDANRGINDIFAHDGHREKFSISQITINGLVTQIINTPDSRVSGEKLGRAIAGAPAITLATFNSQFSPTIRTGVYWLDTTSQTLSRLTAFVQTVIPATTFAEGTTWYNTSNNNLYALESGVWTVVATGSNLTTSVYSVWSVVSLNTLYLDIVLDAETLLYEQAPATPLTPAVDFAAIQAQDPTLYNQLLMQQFNNFVRQSNIVTPFANNTFDPTNPFTWNYKYSVSQALPRSGTIASGGDWRDVYQKTYGTPYPHLEPWLLQGYPDKPSWWDGEFKNDNEAIYGTRRWKYVHELDVVSAAGHTIVISTSPSFDQSQYFRDFTQFSAFNTSSRFVYTVASVTFGAGVTTITTNEVVDSSIETLSIGMWDYVLRGATPAGFATPPTAPFSYAYVSVNISGNIFSDGTETYSEDDVFPPYWNIAAHTPVPLNPAVRPQDGYVRSIFSSTSLEIISENADYVWQDAGPIEWVWRQSTNYLYSLLTIAYLMQPVKTIQQTFGVVFDYIDGLPIDSLTGKVFAHGDTQFHGEISVTNEVIKVNGINQWYINYNRANGYDASYSDFRAMWTAWTAPLAYQFGATIDTQSFSIDHRVIEIAAGDYELTMKRSPGVSNSWIDAFNVRVVSIPPIQGLFDTEAQWILELDSLAPIARTISYYDVKNYDYYIDPVTNICSLFTYPIVGASVIEKTFTVDGDVSDVFGGLNGTTTFNVTGSTTNIGSYTVASSSYNATANQTTIVVSGAVPTLMVGGLLTATNYRTLPWATGTLLTVSTTEIAPQPLDTTLQYFIIKLSPTTFQLAFNLVEANAGVPIAFTSPAFGIQRIGELYNRFTALGGSTTTHVWSHYAIDNTVTKKFAAPYLLSGMQTMVNILDGYAAFIDDAGYGINVDGSYVDPQTGQRVGWQNEIERFINWAYTQRRVRKQRQNDKYAVGIDYTYSQMAYTSQNPNFATGTPVVMWAFGGGLPFPLIRGQTYYIINNGTNVQIALTAVDARAGNAISLIPVPSSQLYLSAAALYLAELPTYEINPFRNALWYSPDEGVVTNLVTGPFVDINSTQLLFDQYGRQLAPGDIRVFRQDKITQIQFAGGVYNDTNVIQSQQQNPYLYLHLGGGNIFIDTYEHVILFDDYTSAGALIYDPFLGVNATKFELDFYKQSEFTERPNVGGYFLSTNYNQGANLGRNIEASVNDIRYMYDIYNIPESLPAAQRARALLGYPGQIPYLQDINLTPKSQFLFWLGAQHAKGSVNAINAFVRSRRFVSANVDAFWAYKLADFGSAAEQDYLSLLLQITDTQTNDLHLEFVRSDEVCLPGYAVNTFGNENCGYANPQGGTEVTFNVDPSFIPVATTDQTRWYNQPDQLQQLLPEGGTLYFSLKPQQKLTIYPVTLGATTGLLFNPYGPSVETNPASPLFSTNLTDEVAVIAYDPTNSLLEAAQQNPYTFWFYNTSDNGFWEYGGGWNGTITLPIFRHNFKADEVQMTINWYGDGYQQKTTIPTVPANVKEWTISPYLPLTNSLQVFENGVQLIPGTDYVESLEQAPGSTVLGNKLYFVNSISGSTMNVVYGSSLLNSSLQYNNINTNIVQFLSQEIVAHMFVNNFNLTMWGLETDKETQNPAKIIDELAQVVLSPVTFWDPARGYQYYRALHSIDIQTNSDPAIYNSLDGWKNQEVGKTWMDTTNVQYLPYYDPAVITDQEVRFGDWGDLTDYGKVRIFQWVQSEVAPADYNALAAAQENDGTIDESIRKSGTVRQDVRYRTRGNTTVSVLSASEGQTLLTYSAPIVSTDSTGLAPSITPPVDVTRTFTVTIDGTTTRQVSLAGSSVVTYGDLVSQINGSISQYGATASLVGNDLVITSNSTGPSSTILISASDRGLFTSLTNYSSIGASTTGVDSAAGLQSVNFTTALTAATSTGGLGYIAGGTTSNDSYTIAVSTVGANVSAFINDNQQPWFSTNETRTALGSEIGTFGELLKWLATFTSVTVTNTSTTITLTNTVPAAPSEPATYPSLVSFLEDSIFFTLPGYASIAAAAGTTVGSHGSVTVTFSTAFSSGTSTGLAPVTTASVDPVYSFNLTSGMTTNTVSFNASDAQTYGELISTLRTLTATMGVGVQLSGTEIIFSSNTLNNPVTITAGNFWNSGLAYFSGIVAAVAPITASSGAEPVITTVQLNSTTVTGLGPATTPTSPTYTFTINVDGTFSRTLVYQASQVSTFAQLLSLLTTQFAVYNATITLSGNEILIQSNTVGAASSLTITADTLFSSITNFVSNVPTAGHNQLFVAASLTEFAAGDSVLFSSTGTLPAGLTQSQPYTIGITAGVLSILGTTVTSEGSGLITMCKATFPDVWALSAQVQADIDATVDAVSSTTVDEVTTYVFNIINCLDPAQAYATPLFSEDDTVNIYLNGKFNQTMTLSGDGPWPLTMALSQADRLTIILPVHTPTATELAFDPDTTDDGTLQIQYQYITNFNAVQTVDLTTNQNVFTYYFWVENVTTSAGDREPPTTAVADLVIPPEPYMFFNKLVGAQVVTNGTQTIQVPDRFVQAIIHGLRGYVDADNRYVLRFTRDFTLRDNLAFGKTSLQLKDAHQEWLMFRQAQLSNVPRDLWDKITESMIGYKLTDSSIRVPSLARELYDTTYNASTQYGLGTDQTFVNGDLASASIQAYLNDPTNNFYPIDLDTFFNTYNFDTPANIIAAMNEIYTTFSYNNVNNMYFSVLQDALSTQLQYAGLMKTSAIALYGVELLDVNGVFDD